MIVEHARIDHVGSTEHARIYLMEHLLRPSITWGPHETPMVVIEDYAKKWCAEHGRETCNVVITLEQYESIKADD